MLSVLRGGSAAKVIVPSDGALKSATAMMQPIIERLVTNALQAQTLSALRDTLLPRLISGHLRLPEVIEAVEEAAA